MKKLRRPYPQHRVLESAEAHRVLTFFFEKGNVNLSVHQLYLEDIEFAQALLIEGVDASVKLSIAVDIIELFTKKGNGDIKTLIKRLAKIARKYRYEGWFIYADDVDLKNPKIARVVRNQLRANFRSAWQGRIADGDNIWNHVHG